MDDFYSKISRIKEERKLTNSDIGAIVDKKPDAFRIALKRESLSKLEIERLENYFVKTEQVKAQKEPSNERFEDIVARKVSENNRLQLINIGEYHQTVLNELAKQSVRMQQLLIYLEEMEERRSREFKEIKSIIK